MPPRPIGFCRSWSGPAPKPSRDTAKACTRRRDMAGPPSAASLRAARGAGQGKAAWTRRPWMPCSAPMSRSLQGVLIQLVALVFFVAMDAMLKLLVQRYAVPQLMFVRFVAHTLFVVVAVKAISGSVPWRSRAPLLPTARSVLLAPPHGALAVALIYVPLADATAVIFAAPALTVAAAALWLGERVSPRRWLGVAVGLAGVVLAIRPPFLTGE